MSGNGGASLFPTSHRCHYSPAGPIEPDSITPLTPDSASGGVRLLSTQNIVQPLFWCQGGQRLLNLAVRYDWLDKNRLKAVELPDTARRTRIATPPELEGIRLLRDQVM